MLAQGLALVARLEQQAADDQVSQARNAHQDERPRAGHAAKAGRRPPVPAETGQEYRDNQVAGHVQAVDPVAKPARNYALAQFGVATVATLAIGAAFPTAGAAGVLLPCVLLWALLLTTGLMNEGRPTAPTLERYRLLAFNPLVLLLAAAAGDMPSAAVWLSAGLYTLLSMIGLTSIEITDKQLLIDKT